MCGIYFILIGHQFLFVEQSNNCLMQPILVAPLTNPEIVQQETRSTVRQWMYFSNLGFCTLKCTYFKKKVVNILNFCPMGLFWDLKHEQSKSPLVNKLCGSEIGFSNCIIHKSKSFFPIKPKFSQHYKIYIIM